MSYQIAFGPLATPWRGPFRVVLRIAAERITDIEQRDGYAARGLAQRMPRLDLVHASALVSEVCSLHSHHHALAWTLALEQLAHKAVPPRAQALRLLVAEAERAASHLQAAAVIVALLGLDALHRALVETRELVLNGMQLITGHRLKPDFVVPGGVQHDLLPDEMAKLATLLARTAREIEAIIGRLVKQRGVRQRLGGIGRLSLASATELGMGGVVARACGSSADLRLDAPYAGYDRHAPRLVQQRDGDVTARLFVLLLESYESQLLSQRLLHALPDGLWRGDPLPDVPAGTVSVGVEAPAGPLRYTLTSDGVRLTAVEIGSAPLPSRLVLRALLVGQSPEDAPLIVASLAPCAACAEG